MSVLDTSSQAPNRYLVLDLDETVVSTKVNCKTPNCGHTTVIVNDDVNSMSLHLHWRPNTTEFLECCIACDIKLVVFSAGGRRYVDIVCDELKKKVPSFTPVAVLAHEATSILPSHGCTKHLSTVVDALERLKMNDFLQNKSDITTPSLSKDDYKPNNFWVIDDGLFNYLRPEDHSRVIRIPAWDAHMEHVCIYTKREPSRDIWLWMSWIRVSRDWNINTPNAYTSFLPKISAELVDAIWQCLQEDVHDILRQHDLLEVYNTAVSTCGNPDIDGDVVIDDDKENELAMLEFNESPVTTSAPLVTELVEYYSAGQCTYLVSDLTLPASTSSAQSEPLRTMYCSENFAEIDANVNVVSKGVDCVYKGNDLLCTYPCKRTKI